MPNIRYDRINEEVKKTVSELIREMKDPRISAMATITQCEVTRDLKYAKLRVSVYDKDEAVRKETVDALNHAAGFLSREMGRRMRIRAVPQMHFELDDSIAYSVYISNLINQLHTDPQSGDSAGTDGEAPEET